MLRQDPDRREQKRREMPARAEDEGQMLESGKAHFPAFVEDGSSGPPPGGDAPDHTAVAPRTAPGGGEMSSTLPAARGPEPVHARGCERRRHATRSGLDDPCRRWRVNALSLGMVPRASPAHRTVTPVVPRALGLKARRGSCPSPGARSGRLKSRGAARVVPMRCAVTGGTEGIVGAGVRIDRRNTTDRKM